MCITLTEGTFLRSFTNICLSQLPVYMELVYNCSGRFIKFDHIYLFKKISLFTVVKNVGCNLFFHEGLFTWETFISGLFFFFFCMSLRAAFETLFAFSFSGFTSRCWTISCYHINKSCSHLSILYDLFFCLHLPYDFIFSLYSFKRCWLNTISLLWLYLSCQRLFY